MREATVISVEYDRVWDTHTLTVKFSSGLTKVIEVDEGALAKDAIVISGYLEGGQV